MDVLRAAYPQFYRGMTEAESRDVLNLWSAMFAEDDPRLVAYAVRALIACDAKGFPPHIGAVRDYMRRIARPREMTEQEAWAVVLRAVRNSAYDSERQFHRLPPDIRAAVGSPAVLKSWALSDESDLQVIASNFQRSYRARRQSDAERDALPGEVRRYAAALAKSSGAQDGGD